jgi:outer membrane protein assembly factor BamB
MSCALWNDCIARLDLARSLINSDYICDGESVVQTRWDGVVVLNASPTYRVLAHHRMESDSSGFNATPAFSDNQIFLRSNTCLYCVSKEVD